MLEYNLYQQKLRKLSTIETISSIHGLLCGYLIVKPEIKLKDWLDEVLEGYHSDTDDLDFLATIFNHTIENLNDSTLEFELLIAPDDNIKDHLISTIDWCNGFLQGLGLYKINVSDPEVDEIIRNIIEITKIDVNIKNNSDDEDSVLEIIEFVRMGVLLIQEIINPSKQDFVNPLPVH